MESKPKLVDDEGSPSERKATEDEGEQPDIVQTDEADKRSIFVKNVDYSSTKEQIMEHFKSCGKINRVTIVTDRFTRHPKGCCYVEFTEPESVENALQFTDSIFNGRTIQVLLKRTNLPHKSKRPPGRGRGGPGQYGGRGGFVTRRGAYVGGGHIPGGKRGFHPYK